MSLPATEIAAAARARGIAHDVIEVGEPEFGEQGNAEDTAFGALGHQQRRLDVELALEM